jgi:SAM-dependent methyltransferase
MSTVQSTPATVQKYSAEPANNISAMDVPKSNPNEHGLRLLVVIASFGDKNLPYLKSIIQTYRSMALAVDVIVTSNLPKDLGPDVEVVVGLPSKNPWSLPFAHKSIFAENVNSYDVFVYSEDDMAVTEKNIQAFLRVTPQLASDEIAGYLRYEIDPIGNWSLPEMHGTFHWKPESVHPRGDHTVAEFSNEHAGFYVLTQAQLRRAIASNGFLRAPHEGRYGMLETAATDPYIHCGFRKVICISALDDFLIHHMPNRYVSQFGLPLSRVKEQVETLVSICHNTHPASTLCKLETKFARGKWSKHYYDNPCAELLIMVPSDAQTILSIGCGLGDAEAQLKQRGAVVTALPLDSVVGAAAAHAGIEVVYGSFEQCSTHLGSRKFDCVFLTDLLHLNQNPGRMLEDCASFVGAGGTLVLSGPNFDFFKILFKRLLRMDDYGELSNFLRSGINPCGPVTLKPFLHQAGLRLEKICWFNPPTSEKGDGKIASWAGKLTARNWIVRARRQAS